MLPETIQAWSRRGYFMHEVFRRSATESVPASADPLSSRFTGPLHTDRTAMAHLGTFTPTVPRRIRLQPWEPVFLNTTHMLSGGHLFLPQQPHPPPVLPRQVSGVRHEFSRTRLILFQGIQFKHSPFFRIEKVVSSVVECPGTIWP